MLMRVAAIHFSLLNILLTSYLTVLEIVLSEI